MPTGSARPANLTILIYGHYDVQPEDPVDKWESPPFEATVRGENLYARGAADDKGQVFIHLKAIEAFLKNNGALPLNIKLIIEGEEEIGSEHLGPFVAQTQGAAQGRRHPHLGFERCSPKGCPRSPTGCAAWPTWRSRLTGPNSDLHSGSFGGSVHNPIQALAEMIASLHDKNGRITVKGMYDDVRPLSKAERAAFKKLPWNDRKYREIPRREGTLR